jgi:hypothetical protein
VKGDFAETVETREETPDSRAATPVEDPPEPPPAPAAKSLPDLKGALMRTRPFLHKAGLWLRKAWSAAKRASLAVWRVLSVTGRALRRFFKKDSIPNLALVLALLTTVTAAGLGITQSLAEPRIADARAEMFKATMGTVFPDEGLTFTRSSLGENIYEGRDGDGRLAGFSILVSPRGHTGPVDMIVGVDLLREVTGVEVVAHREIRDFSAAVEQGIMEALASFDRGIQP